MATVQELLDKLVAGEIALAEVVADFRERKWPPFHAASEAEVWGVTDDDAPDDDSWATVSACAALTADQYAALAAAYESRH